MKAEESQFISANMDNFHLIVGRILSQYSFLDQVINSTIWRLSGVDPRVGICLTSQISTHSKIKLISNLLYLRDGSEEYISKLNKLESKNHKISKIRNRLAHDPIIWNDDIKSVELLPLTPISEGEGKFFTTKKLDMQEINKHLVDVSKHMQGFVEFYKTVDSWLTNHSPGWRQEPGSFGLGEIEPLE